MESPPMLALPQDEKQRQAFCQNRATRGLPATSRQWSTIPSPRAHRHGAHKATPALCAATSQPRCNVSKPRARSLPPTPSITNGLAATLVALKRFPEAAGHYREAIARDPCNADSHHGFGWTLEQMQQLEPAVAACREAVRRKPGADGSHKLGNCPQALGRFDEAHAAYRRAIDGAPRVPLYYRNFVQITRLAADDPVFASIERLVSDAASLEVADQAQLHFA
ncbi:tetratricopeptide repeat protein [Paraburkholderia sediminicola]|uniref:Tetratricopeptide repeat protein n=1 Tax=Paraburkholderia rhynchosiae TaxID=487049 RepID=A0ACC7NH43_9BURK